MKKKLDVVKLKQGLGDTVSSLLALLLAFVVSGLIVMIPGANPFEVFASLSRAGLGSGMAMAGTLNRMAPHPAGRPRHHGGQQLPGVFNMGFTSQFLMGFLCAGFVGYMVPLPAPLGSSR